MKKKRYKIISIKKIKNDKLITSYLFLSLYTYNEFSKWIQIMLLVTKIDSPTLFEVVFWGDEDNGITWWNAICVQ